MSPPCIPRPTPLPTPNFDEYEVQSPSWSRQRAPIAAWWHENRRLRGVFDKHPTRHGYQSKNGLDAWATFLLAVTGLSQFVDHGQDGPDWSPVRVLGEGGYGMAGLWQRRDEEGRVWAEVVIKEEQRRTPSEENDVEYELPGHRGLTIEAVLQRDLNQLEGQEGNININHLYDFKWNTFSNHFRMYMINNPHQDLGRLKSKYAMFDTFLPELFLWTVFISLLEGVLLMETDPVGGIIPAAIPPGYTADARPFMLHLDLKLNNVFLDYAKDEQEKHDLWDKYPVVRIGDFGLARYTHAFDELNPVPRLQWRGTKHWKPPEASGWKLEDKFIFEGKTVHDPTWTPEPDDDWQDTDRAYDDPPNAADQKFTKSHSLWCVGKILMDLMTMHDADECQRVMDETEEDLYRQKGNHFLDRVDSIGRTLDFAKPHAWEAAYDRFPYSDALQEVVRDCLTPAASERPLTEDVLRRAKNYRDAYMERLRTVVGDDRDVQKVATRLYFQENEINQMPRGPAAFPNTNADDYHRALTFDDPDWERFTPPAEKWGVDTDPYPQYVTVIERNGRLYFGQNLDEARQEAERGEQEIKNSKPPKTREQWLIEDYFTILQAVAVQHGWTERQARVTAARRSKEELIEFMMANAHGAQDGSRGARRGESSSSSDLSSPPGSADLRTPPGFNGGRDDPDSSVAASKRPGNGQGSQRRKAGKKAGAGARKGQAKVTSQKQLAKGGRVQKAAQPKQPQKQGLRKSRRLQGENPA